MKRIDAHQHFWHYDPVEYDWISEEMAVLQRDFLPADLEPLLRKQNIDGCVAVQARQTEEETNYLLDFADRYEHVVGVVGWVDLRSDHLASRLEAYQPFGRLKGIRHIVQAEPDPEFMNHEAFVRGVKMLGEFDLTYDILVVENQFPMVVRFLEQCPEQPFVLDHLGKPVIGEQPTQSWINGIKAMAEHPNVYCKISGMVTEADWSSWTADTFKPYLDVVAEAFGPQRLMYGSDWLVCLLAAEEYSEVAALAQPFAGQFSEEEQTAIFGGNAVRFYKL